MKLQKEDIKKIKIAGGIALAITLGYFLFFRKKATDTGGQLTDPTTGGDTSTGYVFNAHLVAENLYEAMKNIGTDEDTIFSVLANVNQAQFAKVIQAFGNRNYNTYTGNTLGWTKHPLKTWLKSELSDSDYATLRLKYPNYL